MTTGRARRLGADDGAASLEYAGVLALVGMVVMSLVLAATPIGGALKSRICAALGASCGNTAAQDRYDALTKCVLTRSDRTLAYGGNVRIFNIDRKDSDRLTVNADGSASITLTQSSAGGVGLSGKTIKRGGKDTPFSLDAKIQVVGDVAYVYNVPKDWGGEEAAQHLLDDNAGTFDRYGNLVLGPWATSAREAANRAVDGIKTGWRWALDKTGISHESDADRAARERAESLSQADAIQVSLGLQGSAGVSADGGIVKGTASGTASAKGTVQVSLNGSGDDKATSNFTATVDVKGTLEGVVGWPGDGRPGQAPTADIPPFLQGALIGGATWSYKVEYDSDGNPAKLTLTTETSGQVSGGLKPPKLGVGSNGTSVNGKAGASVGSAHVQDVVLDLTDPENRAAFDGLFLTYGVGVGDHRAQVSQMRTYDFANMMAKAQALQDRVQASAIVAEYDYDLSGTNIGAGGQSKPSGVDFVIAGVNWEDSSLRRALTSATGYDMSQGGLQFQIAGCGQ